jgi:hypothetical protein
MTTRKIDVEESQKFVDLGILCISDGNHKSYFKIGPVDKDGNTELIALSREEKKQFGIVEESLQEESNDHEIDIEESEGEDDDEGETETERKFREEKKKADLILKGSPEAIERARQLLENAKANEDENQDLKSKLGLAAEKALQKKKQELGLNPNSSMTPDEVLAYEKGLQEKNSNGKGPSGTAPLNRAQLGERGTDLYHTRFSNPQELISTLQKLSHEGNAEAQSYLDKLTEQFVRVYIHGKKPLEEYHDPNSPENLPDLKKEGNYLTPVRKEEGDLGRLIDSWRIQAKRKREEGKE